MTSTGLIVAVARDSGHRFSKPTCDAIRLVVGQGVEGDAHFGRTVQHLSRQARTPHAPNLRQVHLLQAELLAELDQAGFVASPGAMGENITTSGIELLALPRRAQLRLGDEAVIEITGLRNPCHQIDDNIGHGAMAAALDRQADGTLIRKAGVMAVVIKGGVVRPGDPIVIDCLPTQFEALEPV